jgi:hypothetical protein
MARTKTNVPNGLLRRATAGTQGGQKSIGNLSNYGYPAAGKTSRPSINANYQPQPVNSDGGASVENYHLRLDSEGSAERIP